MNNIFNNRIGGLIGRTYLSTACLQTSTRIANKAAMYRPIKVLVLKCHSKIIPSLLQTNLTLRFSSTARNYSTTKYISKENDKILSSERKENDISGGEIIPDSVVHKFALFIDESNRYAVSEQWFLNCLSNQRQIHGSTHETTIETIKSFAQFYNVNKKYSLALPLWEEYYKSLTTAYGDDNPLTIDALCHLAMTNAAIGDESHTTIAVSQIHEWIDRRTKVLEKYNENSIQVIKGIASLYLKHREDNIEDNFNMIGLLINELLRDQTICSDIRFGNDRDTLTSMYTIASKYAYKLDRTLRRLICEEDDPIEENRNQNALYLFQQCYRIQCIVLSDNHEDTLKTLLAIANWYINEEIYDKALSLLEECLHKYNTKYTNHHAETLKVMNLLGCVYAKCGDYDKSLSMHQECLSLRREVLGVSHVDTMATQHNVAIELKRRGDYINAFELFQDNFTNCTNTLGKLHPSTLIASMATIDTLNIIMKDADNNERK